MKITEVRVYGKLLPMASNYNMSSAAVGEPDTTIVELVTDTAYVGWGEICPTGPLPQPEHAGSIRADLVLLCPALIGLDPRQLGLVHDAMASTMDGGHGAKSAVDIACWDLRVRPTASGYAIYSVEPAWTPFRPITSFQLGHPKTRRHLLRTCRTQATRNYS